MTGYPSCAQRLEDEQWMPSTAELSRATRYDIEVWNGFPNTKSLIHRATLERVVEELRNVAKHSCQYCLSETNFKAPEDIHKVWAHRNHDGSVWLCNSPAATKRLAALRAELEEIERG